MKKVIYGLLFLTFFISSIVNSQWKRIYPGNTNNIRDIQFATDKIGWACGDNIIYKTTNGGYNWFTQPNPALSAIQQIYPVDTNVVYAAGYYTILKTTNGGSNWIGLMVGIYGSGYPVLEGLHFINHNTGWFCGNLRMLKTTDGGQTFDSSYINGSMHDIYFRNNTDGICTGEYIIYRTTNGGENWISCNLPNQYQQPFIRVSFINSHTGHTVGGGGITLKTTNFGITWDSIGRIVVISHLIYSSVFTSENIGYAGGEFGVLYKTTNGGITWGFQDTSGLGQGFYRSFWGFNDTIVWAVGGGGKIIYTTNGGKWLVNVNNISTEIPDGFKLYQNYPNPFNGSTKIEFAVNQKSEYKLEVYDIRGRILFTVFKETLQPGKYSTNLSSEVLPTGVYFYRLEGNGKYKTNKLVVIK